ncbi:hypothetical protein AAG570_011118 [Ranatra chinensis]|uniref:T-box domain-containing protein n=1 Tax=Ranatra chinensis TaxID=642074 RepID=A0ABD0YJP1_9HEMI
MFPPIKVRLRGLDPSTKYIVFMDIVPADNHRYKYLYHSCQWSVCGSGEESDPSGRIYLHPDSPAAGSLWTAQDAISFEKLKLTNNSSPVVNGQIPLHSMQKYLPRVHVVAALSGLPVRSQAKAEMATTFAYPETCFITVTAYQNQKITRLKIESNPFAKGFRENSRIRSDLFFNVSHIL